MTKRLMLKHHEGPLFRTESGVPWTPHSVNCQFVRLQQRMGRAVLREKKVKVTQQELAQPFSTSTAAATPCH
jgi:hypothetical protein